MKYIGKFLEWWLGIFVPIFETITVVILILFFPAMALVGFIAAVCAGMILVAIFMFIAFITVIALEYNLLKDEI